MSPEVFQRKLALLRGYRADLKAIGAAGPIEQNHYAVERLIQLIVECMYDIVSHWLADHGHVHPDTYAEVFQEAAKQRLLSPALAESLAHAARMRNLLVHGYERIDLGKLAAAVPTALTDTDRFLDELRSHV